jgi:small subunit ribosomal protein S17
MADEKKNETTEETEPSVDEVSDTTETVDAAPAAAEAAAPADEVSDTAETVDEAPAAAEVPDTAAEVEPAAPAAEEAAAPAEEVSDTPAEEPAPAKKQRSLRHVPRSARRTRSKPAREKPATRKPIVRTETPETIPGRRQERRGVVVSDKGDKTIVVKVDLIKSHPKYKKVVRSTVKFHAHDEQNTAGVGDTVRIVETRPLSKTKRWRLAEIVEKAR